MFLRFVIHQNDPDSGRRQGLFQAMADLKRDGALLQHEQDAYAQIYDWFARNLKKPQSLARSSKPHAKAVALSWFKASARQHIDRMREVSQILSAHGIDVVELKTARPGYVVYEDTYQVAAEPFSETGA